MAGHSAANIIPVVAANRVGTEVVEPSSENSHQSSSLTFYGSSFMTDMTGDILESASRDQEEVLIHTYDMAKISSARLEWGLMRDRRPKFYGDLMK